MQGKAYEEKEVEGGATIHLDLEMEERMLTCLGNLVEKYLQTYILGSNFYKHPVIVSSFKNIK